MSVVRFDLQGRPPNVPLTIGRADHCDFQIRHKSVSREHAVVFVDENGRVELRDNSSSFGTFVNNSKILTKVLADGDVVRFGRSESYRFSSLQFDLCPESVGMSIRFENLSIRRDGNQILHEVNASIEADEFVAITGPSGCGKSTLLACLTCSIPPSSGRVVFDGSRDVFQNLEYYIQKTGAVPQDILLFEDLTVRENLEFSARIKVPEASDEKIRAAVEDALKAVEMEAHQHKRVSVLSGGQKKRVNVAVELITRPRLLLLDEPTSGLDPDKEAYLFDKLKGLTRRGMTVVCVVHSTQLYHFDKVIQLRERKDPLSTSLAYCGPPDARDFSARNTTAGDPDSAQGSSTSRPPSRRAPSLSIQRPLSKKRFLLRQAGAIALRSALCFARDRESVFMSLTLPVLLALLIVLSQKAQNSPSFYCFFLVISAFWMGMTASVREIVKERKLFIRDKFSGLDPDAFLGGKAAFVSLSAAAQAVLLLGCAAFFFWLFYSVAGFNTPEMRVVAHSCSIGGALLAVVPIVAAGFSGALAGLLVSAVASTERQALTWLPFVLLPQILFSRTAYGQGNEPLNTPPFGVIWGSFPKESPFEIVIWLPSIFFPTRPCALTMTLCFDRSGGGFAALIEWAYLFVLLALVCWVLWEVFESRQREWREWR